MICYSSHCVETIMNLIFDSTKVKWFAHYHTNLSHEIPLSFVCLKFSCFGWAIDMRRIRSDMTLILGIPKAPQGNIQWISKQLSLGMPRKASPLSSPTLSVTSLGAMFLFTTWYVFCLESLVWFESLFFILPQSSLLYTPFERATHDLEFVRMLYVLRLYLLSYIILL